MHIVIAPNAFKNSLDAEEVAQCIEKGLKESLLSCTCARFPVADGGDGTAGLLITAMKGRNTEGIFSDPCGKKITASFGLIENGNTAVIEMAAASGLRLLDSNELDPMRVSSVGTGEMIAAALDLGVRKIIVTLGGSATVDGGCGILHALGIVFFDKNKNKLSPVPEQLVNIDSIDVSGLDRRIENTVIELWCDVQNSLLGESGAAAVFGPQKGATQAQVITLDRMLHNLNEATISAIGKDVSSVISGGAAGGTAAFLHALLDAKLVNGIEAFLHITGFEQAIGQADIVITGEGEIDRQTLHGKGPFGVAMAAARKNVKVIAIAGKVPPEYDPQLAGIFPVLFSIGNRPATLEESIALTGQNLIRVARQIGNLLSFNA